MRRLLLTLGLLLSAAGAQSQWRHFGDSSSPGSTDSAPAPPASPRSQARQMLDAHNAIRARLNLPALRWSDGLASYAQEWANNLAARGTLEHHRRPRYGENLFMISGVKATASPARVVADWASEARYYDYSSNSCRRVCGHYTQIIWRDTLQVGCAVGRGRGIEIWVCEYDPPGNVIGYRPY